MLFGWHQVLGTGAQQQKHPLQGTSFTETKCTFLIKLMRFAQQDAIKVDQPQKQ